MKMQENIRIIEILSAISFNLISNVFIRDNNILNILAPLSLDIYFLDCIMANYTEKMTKEYREIEKLYNELINNIAEFYKTNGFNNPISIYASYVYMYRMGLFSYNKAFSYNTDMKDFPGLNGIDVVRGFGVCRSIASMLTDIYHNFGLSSQNLAVNINPDILDSVDGFNPIPLSRSKKVNSNLVVKIFGNMKWLANHQVTMVQDSKYNYILDPTNDLFLINNGNKLMIDDTNYMKIDNYTNTIQRIFGYDNNSYNALTEKRLLKMPTITRDEFFKEYLEILKLCISNKLLLTEFYLKNQKLINDIHNVSNKEHSVIKRKIPILPIK